MNEGNERFMKHLSPTARFALPVIVEKTAMIAVTQVSSSLIGRISPSSLAAAGTINVLDIFLTAAFTLINTGAAVLIARQIGARSWDEAAETIEQSVGFIMLAGLAVMAALILGAKGLMKLLMPGAEAALYGEAVLYLRMMSLSFPLLMLSTLLCSALRAEDRPRTAMAVRLGANALQVIAVWVLVGVLKLGLVGAALSYMIGRFTGAAATLVMIARVKTPCAVRLRRAFRPNLRMYGHTFRVGAPTSLEQTAVQGGYVLANALAVGLGTLSATVYQVCNTLHNLTSLLPSNICIATVLALVGQRLGEGREKEAERLTWRIWLAGVGGAVSVGLLIALFGHAMAGLYSTDETVIATSRPILWLLAVCAVPALSINVVDSTLKCGGDGRFTMIESLIGVWLVRLPLTWLFAYRFGWGVMGVFLANFANLTVRASLGMIRFLSRKWIHQNV